MIAHGVSQNLFGRKARERQSPCSRHVMPATQETKRKIPSLKVVCTVSDFIVISGDADTVLKST